MDSDKLKVDVLYDVPDSGNYKTFICISIFDKFSYWK